MSNLANVIGQYLKRGFGSMNKNDFEVWIFYYLLQNQLVGKSNYDISVDIRIPESKVKRLRYEAELKYGSPNDPQRYIDAFEKLLSKSVLKKDGSCVLFIVEDIQLRKFLDSVLKKGGRFSDTSFNSEIVSMDANDLEYLQKELWPDKEWNLLYEGANRKIGKQSRSLSDLLKSFASGMAEQTGKMVVNLTYAGLLALIK